MIVKVVSGGQTGVDRAGLDAALQTGLACGGWCPKGRLAEDGPLPSRYPLIETPLSDYSQRTLWNVRDSDGTLVLHQGPITGGTALTIGYARELAKPCLCVDLLTSPEAEIMLNWARENRIRTLNVAGPRESGCPGIHQTAMSFLLRVLRSSLDD